MNSSTQSFLPRSRLLFPSFRIGFMSTNDERPENAAQVSSWIANLSKKIHERITAVSAMLAALQRAETEKSCKSDLTKAADKLGKILSEADIRSFMENMMQKNSTEMA